MTLMTPKSGRSADIPVRSFDSLHANDGGQECPRSFTFSQRQPFPSAVSFQGRRLNAKNHQ
jgi:hypothetical protein